MSSEKKCLVMKFGGASVATPESFNAIASIIKERKKEYAHVAIVVSAMANHTDELINLAKRVHPNPPKREYDMLVTVGERVSIALLAMALANIGVEATSFTGSQSGIITCNNHSEATIVDVRPYRLLKCFDDEKLVIVAGFQGCSTQGEITTLGRGGSDTSAVALGIALGASHVEFYKDVGGIFSDDPKKSEDAKLYPFLSFDDALSLIETKNAKVLHPRSVKLARKNGMPLHVRAFQEELSQKIGGTWIGEKEPDKTPVYES